MIHLSPGGLRGRGGVARFVLYLKEAMDNLRSNFTIQIVDSYGPGSIVFMPVWFLGAMFSIVVNALIRRSKVIIHIHMAVYGSVYRKLTLLMVARVFGCRTILHLHGADFDEFIKGISRWRRAIAIAIIKRADLIVTIGSYWQQYVVTSLGVHAQRVRLVHNGAPPPLDVDLPRNSSFRILALGELGRRKGTADLIEALYLLRDHPLEWSAVLAGNGNIDEYRRKVIELGLEDRIHIPGWIERDMAQRELAGCDVFALPSYHEGLPIAILEAMAMGRAIITTPVGAITDAIVSRHTGLIVNPGDVQALYGALRELLEDRNLRQQLGAQASASFREHFDIRRTAQSILDLYQELSSETR